MKPVYTPPKLTDLGTLSELTLGNKTGTATDAAFPAHTLPSSFTFS